MGGFEGLGFGVEGLGGGSGRVNFDDGRDFWGGKSKKRFLTSRKESERNCGVGRIKGWLLRRRTGPSPDLVPIQA